MGAIVPLETFQIERPRNVKFGTLQNYAVCNWFIFISRNFFNCLILFLLELGEPPSLLKTIKNYIFIKKTL